MLEDIRLNTLRVSKDRALIERLKHSKATHLTSGVCQFVVELDERGRIGCGIHPQVLEGEADLRVGFCGHTYLCMTYLDVAKLTPTEQSEFLTFVKEQELDDYDYSLGIVSGTLFEEFEAFRGLGKEEAES